MLCWGGSATGVLITDNCLKDRAAVSINYFYAFDMLLSDGDDIRKLPLSMRKASFAKLLARRVDGIFLSDFEQGEIGPNLFRHACLMGLEGLVSKRADSRYRGGRSPDWVKIKNRQHPAMERVMQPM